jgi:hypothetical protein
MEMVVGMGGIRVHPLWMDAMEEVVWMGGLCVHPLRMHGMRNMLGVGRDGPPRTVQVMEEPSTWSRVTQKLWEGVHGEDSSNKTRKTIDNLHTY